MTKRLKIGDKQKTSYCIPDWLKFEQIKSAQKRKLPSIQPGEEKSEPIAVVGFGPSLQDTWELVKHFKVIISCSGAHKFLVDRGVIPTHHVEVDPRDHKIHLIGQPQSGTEYLISSTCHPKVFDHLEGQNVRVWDVFDATEEGRRAHEPGTWAITGGCDAGLRAMTIAAFLGYRDLHIFGLDGSARNNEKHAADHPNKVPSFAEVEYPEGSGTIYYTTSGMLEAARQVGHELDQLPKVKATFYGEGLIQAMYKNYEPKKVEVNKPYENIVAFAKPELISDEYRELNAKLHSDILGYGVGGGRHAKTVQKLCKSLKSTSVLDYGCGKGYLAKELPFPIWEYDPAIPGKDAAPRAADLVVCADVLEHIEPEKLDFVLDDLRRCTKKVGYFVVHTGPSSKILADGRNSHLIQQPKAWWEEKMGIYFQIGKVLESGHLLYFVVGPKKAKLSVAKAA
jgi:uncharacterized Rossmann fold enzyme